MRRYGWASSQEKPLNKWHTELLLELSLMKNDKLEAIICYS